MDSVTPQPSLWWTWLRRLLVCLSQDGLALLLELAPRLSSLWVRPPADLYENLHYSATLELLDTAGQTALFTKAQRVRFLQDHIIAFEDYAWGDGDILGEYGCSPGVVADQYREGDRWTILISLREAKRRGDIEEFHMGRVERGAFTQPEEWLQVEIRRPTHHLQMSIIFPQARPCRRAVVLQRSRPRVIPLGPEHMHALPDGRQLLRWETKHIRPYQIFTLKWWW